MAGSPIADGEDVFDDVASGTWYTDAVVWANNNGIVNGVTEKRFEPSTPISRQDLVVLLARYIDFNKISLNATRTTREFSDQNSIADYAKAVVNLLTGYGLINGKPENLFDPLGTATRAEAAAILHRLSIATAK